jgi:hypothetical protein
MLIPDNDPGAKRVGLPLPMARRIGLAGRSDAQYRDTLPGTILALMLHQPRTSPFAAGDMQAESGRK